MRYKSKVIAQVPNARPVVLRRFPDGEPKYIAIYNGENGRVPMDVVTPDDLNDGWGGDKQGHNAAWRSAYYWLVRQKKTAA